MFLPLKTTGLSIPSNIPIDGFIVLFKVSWKKIVESFQVKILGIILVKICLISYLFLFYYLLILSINLNISLIIPKLIPMLGFQDTLFLFQGSNVVLLEVVKVVVDVVVNHDKGEVLFSSVVCCVSYDLTAWKWNFF